MFTTMSSRWSSLLLAALALAGCAMRQRPFDSHSPTIDFGGRSRTYAVHLPPTRPAGLVLNLHGGDTTGAGQEWLTNFDAVADANGFAVAYPDGIDKSWADGRGASEADQRGVDDVGFLVALTQKLRAQYGIDAGHVFATGMSNGGFMANRLACDHAELFAAVAPVSGTLGSRVTCHPSRPVAVLDIHGTADPIVPFDAKSMRTPDGSTDIVTAPAMVQRWRAEDRCSGEPAADTLPDVGDGTTVHRFSSASCAAGTAVVFYQVDGGGHTWPGGAAYPPAAGLGTMSRGLNASAVIGQFFVAHAR
jgi:polyhydroxybutyrate depolymerase